MHIDSRMHCYAHVHLHLHMHTDIHMHVHMQTQIRIHIHRICTNHTNVLIRIDKRMPLHIHSNTRTNARPRAQLKRKFLRAFFPKISDM